MSEGSAEAERVYHRDYLSLFDASGRRECGCGRCHTLETAQVLFGRGVLTQAAEVLARRYGHGRRVWVLSDERTEAAAAAALKRSLGRQSVSEIVLPADPKPQPTIENVERLTQAAGRAHPELIVSVGGGTLSDLGKRISLNTGIPSWCVATSPSVDAFTSAKAAIWFRGYHRAIPARVSEVVVCDLEVIGAVPRELFLAGLGDLLGKPLAFLDWHLSGLITGETVCSEAAEYALRSAERALQAAEQMDRNRPRAARHLADAALTSGLLMQSTGSSRPAAGAEHTVAHFWEVHGTVENPALDLHGILTGAASELVLHAYRRLFDRLEDLSLDLEARLERFAREPGWRETLEPAIMPYAFKMDQEMEEKGEIGRDELRRRMSRFETNRERIGRLARVRLPELTDAVDTLDSAGFPFRFEELGAPPEKVWLPFPYERYLRSRYTAFDLMYELGLEEGILDELEGYVDRHP